MGRVITLIFLIIICGCLENSEIITEIELDNEKVLLRNLEDINNDFINKFDIPPEISVYEMYENLDNYIIYDIRGEKHYKAGHIKNAVNVSHKDLWEKVNSADRNKKIIVISYTGQSACYYATLLRYAGFENVFMLEYGMCYWNQYYSKRWPDRNYRRGVINIVGGDKFFPLEPHPSTKFNRLEEYHTYKNLPESNIYSINDLKFKIQKLLEEEFTDTMTAYDETGNFSENTTDFRDITGKEYLMLYGTLNQINKYEVMSLKFIHYPGTVIYYRKFFYSSEYLMTIPPDKEIVVYGVTGTEGACVTAYLRMLGYKAKNIVFGVNSYRSFVMKFAPYVDTTPDQRYYNCFDIRLVEDFEVVTD